MNESPKRLIETQFAGYFFSPETNELFSNKIKNELKPLAVSYFQSPNMSRSETGLIHGEPGYRISHKGKRHFMPLRDLVALRN